MEEQIKKLLKKHRDSGTMYYTHSDGGVTIKLDNLLDDVWKESEKELLKEFILNQDSLEKIQSLIQSKVDELKDK